jgi:hypothetical protein
MCFIAFVAVWLGVSLVLITFDEVLSVVLYNLSCPKLQPQCFGFSTTLFIFAALLPVLVAGLVKVFRSDFLKARSTFLRWSLPLMRLFIAITGVPATQLHRRSLHQPSTRWNASLTH